MLLLTFNEYLPGIKAMMRILFAMAVLITGVMSVSWVGASYPPAPDTAQGAGTEAASNAPRYLTVGDQSLTGRQAARRH